MKNNKKYVSWREVRYWIQIVLLISLTFRGILSIYGQIFSALGWIEMWALITLAILSIASTFGLFYWIIQSNRI